MRQDGEKVAEVRSFYSGRGIAHSGNIIQLPSRTPASPSGATIPNPRIKPDKTQNRRAFVYTIKYLVM